MLYLLTAVQLDLVICQLLYEFGLGLIEVQLGLPQNIHFIVVLQLIVALLDTTQA